MIRFLLKRPIAVVMTTIAFVVLGLVASLRLPISLMPDVDIPEISIHLTRDDASAKEIENTITSVLRSRLQQTANLRKIETKSSDGSGLVTLSFDYGTSIDYAFISVNEKVDAAMNYLPKDLQRPVIIKASASDIPVFYINMSLKEQVGEPKFLDFCEFSESVIKRRLEQLSDVAMVDMSGLLLPELYVLPDEAKMKSLRITQEQLRKAIDENNKVAGSLTIRDGYYQYSIRFVSQLLTQQDVEDVYLNINGRLVQIKDIAEVGIRSKNKRGMFLSEDKQALSLAIIKQSNARMSDMKDKVNDLLTHFEEDYPDIDFKLTRDQALLLDYSITNLRQSLIVGIVLAIIVMLFFLKDGRSPIIIGISVPVSVVISLLFFQYLGLSINTISLSGLIMGVGMMIDNSIIVIDNINQCRDRGLSLFESCAIGTKEIIRPLISSVLTTCAVFIPLIFLSGLAGSLFYDQAMAVTIGLFVSLVVSITIVPVVFNIIFRSSKEGRFDRFIKKISLKNPEKYYAIVYDYLFKYRKRFLVSCILLLVIGTTVAIVIKKERMPQLELTEMIIKTDWNLSIHIDENRRRVEEIISLYASNTEEMSAHLGEKMFLLSRDKNQNTNEAEIYIKTKDNASLHKLLNKIRLHIKDKYPEAKVDLMKVDNIFEQMFKDEEAPLVIFISGQSRDEVPNIKKVNSFIDQLGEDVPSLNLSKPSSIERILVQLQPEKINLYNVSQANLIACLEKNISKSNVSILRTGSRYVPIVLTEKEQSILDIINTNTVVNRDGMNIPLSAICTIADDYDFKTITGRKEGAVIPVNIYNTGNDVPSLIKKIKKKAAEMKFNVYFGGDYFSGNQTLWEMMMILGIAILMLYFILAAQFESLKLPFIVLLEIPIDVAGALLVLYLCGGTLNLMAMIGMIVMCGIIINDSILKIDTINKLREEGYELTAAIHEGGHRRFKPILMTSLTTIFAMLPFLWGNDIGSQLQSPLAIAMVGGMFLGSLVSLFFIPICYYYLVRNK